MSSSPALTTLVPAYWTNTSLIQSATSMTVSGDSLRAWNWDGRFKPKNAAVMHDASGSVHDRG